MRLFIFSVAVLGAVSLFAYGAEAAVVGECDPYVSVTNLSEPWETYSRTYADGAIRVAEAYVSPTAAAGAAIVVLHPNGGVEDYEMFRICTAIYAGPGPTFFAEAMISEATAAYDPSAGLTISVPVRFPDGNLSQIVTFSVNQATGTVTLQ
ncbi:hypothetical protein V8J82_20580 [Gymnodinialimonas sp. 2305UL16-5]|uniref:hypothetical protein n=1 Tax=Gymnodinialimonas mytili TaxID=3126503 RepID=UPI0030AE0CC9